MVGLEVLDKLNDSLRKLIAGDQHQWHRLSGRFGLFCEGLKAAVRLARDGSDIPGTRIEECWKLLVPEESQSESGPPVLLMIQKLLSSLDGIEVDPFRLYNHARALVVTARVAVAGLEAEQEVNGAWCKLSQWAGEAVKCFNSTVSPAPRKIGEIRKSKVDAVGAVEATFKAYEGPAANLAALHYWTLWWLDAHSSAESHRLSVPVAGCRGGGVGFLADLRLTLLKDWPAALIESPEIALRPLGQTLLTEIQRAASRIQKAVCWNITVRDQRGSGEAWPWQVLNGDSLGASAATGFILLDQRKMYDSGCLLLARVADDDSLESVAHIKEKITAARESGIRRIGLSPSADVQADNVEVQLVHCSHLNNAVEFASGLISEVEKYLRLLVELPNRMVNRPAWLGRRNPTEIYTEPDVLKPERTILGESSESDFHSKPVRPSGARSGRPAASRDQPLYGVFSAESERRVSWREEITRIFRNCLPLRAVILGPPGQGKSQLVLMSVRQLAEEGLTALSSGSADLTQIPLPVPLTFKELTKDKAAQLPLERLRNAVKSRLQYLGCPDAVVEYIKDHVGEEQIWLFIDELDEVPEEKENTLREYMDVLKDCSCRLIMTSRPYAYEARSLPFKVTEYRLAPFLKEQSRSLMHKWYPRDENRAGRLCSLLTHGHSVQKLAQNPFLLSLLCWVGETEDLPNEVTRSELYRRVLLKLLGTDKQGNRSNRRRADELLAPVAELALTLFETNKVNITFSHDDLVKYLGNTSCLPRVGTALRYSGSRPHQLTQCLIDELLKKRILAPSDPEQGRFAFPHHSMVGYLAAWELAKRLTADENLWAFIEAKAWDPDWGEVIVFLAGCLSETPKLLKQLLESLSKRNMDDIFRHRLALACRCVGEIPFNQRSEFTELVNKITEAGFGFWWECLLKDMEPAVSHFGEALRVLGLVNGKYQGSRLRDWLANQLASKDDEDARVAAAVTCAGLGAPLCEEELLQGLLKQLEDRSFRVRNSATRAIGSLGPAVANRDVLNKLLERLKDREGGVAMAAAAAIGELRPLDDMPYLKERLLELLADPDTQIPALNVIMAIGTEASSERLVAKLEDLQRCEGAVGIEATRAVRMLRPDRGTIIAELEEYLKTLEALAQPISPHDKKTSAESKARCSSHEVIKHQLDELRSDLNFLRERIRDATAACAADKVMELGPTQYGKQALSRICRLVSHVGWYGRMSIADAIGELGASAYTQDVRNALAVLLTDSEASVRSVAAEAIAKIGPVAMTKELFENLFTLISAERDTDAHLAFAQALSALAPEDRKEEIRKSLLKKINQLAGEVDQGGRDAGAISHEELFKSENVEEYAFMMHLELSRLLDGYVEALGTLGKAAGKPDVLGLLLKIASCSSAKAIREIMSDGVRIFHDLNGDLRVRLFSELSSETLPRKQCGSGLANGVAYWKWRKPSPEPAALARRWRETLVNWLRGGWRHFRDFRQS